MIDKELSELKNDIPDIDIKDFKSGVYKKCNERKKPKIVLKYRLIFSCGIIVILLVSILSFLPKRPISENIFDGYPNVVNPSYNGFIKDSFDNNIGNGPTSNIGGPMPEPPIIDGYFNTNMDYNNPGNQGKPNDQPIDGTLDQVYLEMRMFEYIYEVEYKYIGTGLEYVAVYIEKKLAKKIYEENKEVMDAPNAAPINVVNGSIVDWFYSKNYYDEDKVFWCQYAASDQIYSEIQGFICVGVYQPQQRVIVREVFSNTEANIVDYIYTKLYFKNDGNKTLTPVIDKVDNRIIWYASNNIIHETNTFFLFDYCYGAAMDCVIDKEANTIKLKTYAVQDEDELAKNYSQLLKDYHILSNSVIVKNEHPNNELGENTYITYKYKELVEILQFLSKQK